MNKILLSIFFILILHNERIFAQEINHNSYLHTPASLSDIESLNATQSFLQTAVILFPVNPIFLIENKKFYVGLTKEFSIGKFPYGRLAIEYSVIFREIRLNHLRASYNFDIPVEVGDIAAFMISVGGGYFTDFDKNGYFPQASFNLIVPAASNVVVQLYIKARNTFMTDKTKSDIFDFSLGIGTALYF